MNTSFYSNTVPHKKWNNQPLDTAEASIKIGNKALGSVEGNESLRNG